MARLDIQYCPFCGSKKVGYEEPGGLRFIPGKIRCSKCGSLFSVENLRIWD